MNESAMGRLRPAVLLLTAVAALLPCTFALNVLVAGGSGRVGGSTLRWLQKYSSRDPTLDLTVNVGCRTKESFDAAVRNGVVPRSGVDFVPMDLDGGNDEQLMKAIDGCGLVVNTAGPFQGRRDPALRSHPATCVPKQGSTSHLAVGPSHMQTRDGAAIHDVDRKGQRPAAESPCWQQCLQALRLLLLLALSFALR